jgi:hypothetical protein
MRPPQQLYELPDAGPPAPCQRPLCEGGLRAAGPWPSGPSREELTSKPAGNEPAGSVSLSLVSEAPMVSSLEELEALAEGSPTEPASGEDPISEAQAALLALEDEGLFTGDGGVSGANGAAAAAVTLVAERAPVLAHAERHRMVVRDCADRMLQIARDRDAAPMAGRTKCERRLFAQVDAMVHLGGASIAELSAWYDELATADATWVQVFVLACLEGRQPLEATVAMVQDGWSPAHVRGAAGAFAASPNPHHVPLARALIETQRDAAIALALSVTSLRGALPDADALAWVTRGGPRTAGAALEALSRSTVLTHAPDEALKALGHDDAEVVWQAARLCSRLGNHAAYAELRRNGSLVDKLGPRAAEIYVMVGEPDDAERLQRLVSRYPITPQVLDAVARFGLPTTWSFLSHHLADPLLQADAIAALTVLFGEAADDTRDPFSWETGIARLALDGSRRVRAARPWTPSTVCDEWHDGTLSAQQVAGRLDELSARANLRAPVALHAWGDVPAQGLKQVTQLAAGARGDRAGQWVWR